MSGVVTIKDRQFKLYIEEQRIAEAVELLANKINQELAEDFPLFLVVLNGSFMFASDLLKKITIPCEISFIKVASYHGTSSSGTVQELIGLTEDIINRTVVIVEDIVDSGTTIESLMLLLKKKQAKEIKVATTLFKPGSYRKDFKIDYIGFEIADKFVLGYGMDYEGMGRNLKEIYVLA